MHGTVLVVDDHKRPRKALATKLEAAGYVVVLAGDGAEAWKLFCRDRPHVVMTRLRLPRSDGLALLNRIRVRSDVPVILFTSRGSLQHAAAAFKAGADDFVAIDESNIDQLVELVDHARDGCRSLPSTPEIEQRLVGESPAMSRVRDRISALAALRTPVLLVGEPGSGARTSVAALHDFGTTGGEEFETIESDRFERGRRLPPTGAIYLRNIHLLSRDAQAYWCDKFRSGERFSRSVRVFASTSEPLPILARAGRFERELAHAFQRFAIELPPLREHLDDLADIADALATRIGATIGRRVGISPAAKRALSEYRWPGNCTELAEVLERCIAFSRRRTVRLQLVEEVLSERETTLAAIRESNLLREREALLRAIESAGGNVSLAARTLGRSRGALYRMIEKHGIALNGARAS